MITKEFKLTIRLLNGFLEVEQGSEGIKIPIEQLSERLKQASDFERSVFLVSPSGYGIHWPLIDEDLAIDKLFKDFS